MSKLAVNVVLGIMLSLGIMVAGINPTIRAEVQAASEKTAAVTVFSFGSANNSLSKFFSEEASVQGSAAVSAAAPVNANVLANNTQTQVNAETNGAISFGSGAANAGAGLTGSATAALSSTGGNTNTTVVNSSASTVENAQIGFQAGGVSLNTLLNNQIHSGFGLSK